MFLKLVKIMKIKFQLRNNFLYFLVTLFLALLPTPAHAYAGPGVAIATVIVFLTVVITFFASTLLTIYKFIKKLFIKFFKLIYKNKTIKNNKKSK